MTCLRTYLNRTHEKSWIGKARYFVPFCRAQKKINSLQPNLQESLLIAAFPRSGSTWVQEVFSQLGDFFTLFEPLSNHFGAPEIREIEWDKKIESPAERRRVLDVLSGSYFTPWSNLLYSFNANKPKRLLIKLIRIINQLDWLVEEVNFINPPFVLIRHPVDLNKSQRTNFKNQGIQWNHFKNLFPKEAKLLETEGISIKTPEVLEVARLSIEMKSLYPLQSNGKIHVFKYEDLLANPYVEFGKIVELYHLDRARFEKAMKKVNTPSHSDFGSNYNKASSIQLEKWKNSMEPDVLEKCERVMNLIGNPYY